MKLLDPTNEGVAAASLTDEPIITRNQFSISLFILAFVFTAAVSA